MKKIKRMIGMFAVSMVLFSTTALAQAECTLIARGYAFGGL
jgi:hypothetical protein